MLSVAESSIVASVRRRVNRHGLGATAYTYGMRAVNSAMTLRILRALCLERASPSFRQCPAGYAAGFASRQALDRLATDPECELSPEFVNLALSRGDQCFAIWEGAAAAAYSWYSFRPTPIGQGMRLRFDPSWVYMYKGFTLPRYRGRRLYAFGVAHALEHYRARGFSGLLSYVESTNFDSLKSCFRVGYRAFGSICVLPGYERPLVLSTPGCERLGFRIES